MPTISTIKFSVLSLPTFLRRLSSHTSPSFFTKFSHPPQILYKFSISRKTLFNSKSSEEEAEVPEAEDEWLQKLPDKKKPVYSHSLPCVESWLKSLGFHQSKDDRAVWYLKNGPGNLEKDVERRFSYALSREDIENAVLGGP